MESYTDVRAVPIPAAYLLLLSGFALLGGLRLQRQLKFAASSMLPVPL